MVRQPKECGPDAWKRWLRQGFSLFDRTWSGWMIVWWLFSLGVVLCVEKFTNFFVVFLLVGLSAAAFGMHVAVYNVLAQGKRGPSAWLNAIAHDLKTHYRGYIKSGFIRMVVVGVVLTLLVSFSVGLAYFFPDSVDPAKSEARPFWSLWGVWAWMWLIPAGWQRAGVLGWGHWLIRKEGVDVSIAERLSRLAVAINMRSYVIICAVLMAPVILMMLVFPPLLPLWDLYAAAVCWCIWDDVFGDNEGLKEMEKARAPALSKALSGT